MGKITKEQRAALEAAGYKIGKSGNTVVDKNGGTVGGYNENGQIFSGSAKVKGILKAPPAAKAPAKPATKPAAKPVAKDPMKGYRKGDVTTSKLGTPLTRMEEAKRAARARGVVKRADEAIKTAEKNTAARKEYYKSRGVEKRTTDELKRRAKSPWPKFILG